MWKWLVSAAVLIALLAAAFWYAQPLLALRGLKTALVARDENAVSAQVDFVALRTNVLSHAHRKIEKANQDSVLGGIKDAVEDKLADLKIERLATSSGLIHLVCDKDASGDVDTSPKAPGTPCELKGKVRGFHYEGSTRFDVLVRRPQGDSMTLTLGRQTDGAWKLVDIIGN